MLRPYVSERWSLKSRTNSVCCAGEKVDQFRARTRREIVSKSVSAEAICSSRFRLSSLDISLLRRTSSAASVIRCTTARGPSAARAPDAARASTRTAIRTARTVTSLLLGLGGRILGDVIQLLLLLDPRGGGVRDERTPALKIRVADEAVVVERRALRLAHLVQDERAGVDGVEDARAHQDVAVHEPRRDRERLVDDEAARVADVGRAEQRDHEVGARRHAPHRERLPEVLVVALEPPARGGVEEAEHADRRVDAEARDVDAGGLRLPLQEIVRGHDREAQVGEEVRDRRPDAGRRDLRPAGRDGREDVGVDVVVEPEHLPVDALERVVLGRLRPPSSGTGGEQSGGEENAEEALQGAPCSGCSLLPFSPPPPLYTSLPIRRSRTTADSVIVMWSPDLRSSDSPPSWRET